MRLLRVQVSSDVNVELDAGSSQVNLAKVMEEMREQYEAMMIKNKQDQEKWFNSQVRNSQDAITVGWESGGSGGRGDYLLMYNVTTVSLRACLCPKDADPPVANHHKHNRGEDILIRAV